MNSADWLNIGIDHFAGKRYQDAMAAFTRLPMEFPERNINLSKTLSYLRQPKDALALADLAVESLKWNPQAYQARAFALESMGRFEEALESHCVSLSINRNDLDYYQNIGNCCSHLERYEDAMQWYRDGLMLSPCHFRLRVFLGMAQMLTGDWKEGLENYEFRLALGSNLPQNGKPVWGGEGLDGKVIAIFQEQGIGDAIQFIRYAAMLRSYYGASKVLFFCTDALYRLMQAACYGVDEVYTLDTTGIEYDVHVPMMSLLRQAHKTCYFTAPDYWEYISVAMPLKNNDRRKIGICWKGNSAHQNDLWRSATLDDFSPLLGLDADLISLQYGCRDEALQWGCDKDSPIFADMLDMAETLLGLDAVVTVDTAVAHLAGALGVETYTLLPPNPDWRWGLESVNTGWYPTMLLMRSKRHGGYATSVKEVVRRLR